MNNEDRDKFVLEKIIAYCEEIAKTQMYFGEGYSVFNENSIYRNAIALCILQIGELVGCLSEETKERFSGVPWRNIKGMRNVVAHKYGDISITTVWEAMTEDMPVLQEYCKSILSQLE